MLRHGRLRMRKRSARPALCVAFAAIVVLPGVLGVALAQRGPVPQAAEQEDEVTPEESEPSSVASASVSEASSAIPLASPSGSAPGPREGMIRVPGAAFAMGSSDPKSPANERPRHVESVAPFWIDRTEVTVAAYRVCVEGHACAAPIRTSAWCTYDLGDARLPISCVHWRDAEAYCRSLGRRLPREAEWELAARGPKGDRYPWRSGVSSCYYAATMVNDTTGRACTRGPTRVGGHPAGATPSGIQDLAGNLEEWVSDWYAENVSHGAPAAGASHVLRGGGWQSGPSQARGSARNWGSAAEAGPNVGFRCAKDD